MYAPAPLQLHLRFTRLIIAGYGSVIEARLEGSGVEELRNIKLELHSAAFENDVVERHVEVLPASFLVLPRQQRR